MGQSYTAQDLRHLVKDADDEFMSAALERVASFLEQRDHVTELRRDVERALEEIEWWHALPHDRREMLVAYVAQFGPPKTSALPAMQRPPLYGTKGNSK